MKRRLNQQVYIDFIYSSSVYEGVPLSEDQVKDIVAKGKNSKYLKDDPKNEHLLQTLGQLKALELIEELAKSHRPITVGDLSLLHGIVFEKLKIKSGVYRQGYVKLRSSKLLPSFPFSIAADMRDLDLYIQKEQSRLATQRINQIVPFISYVYHAVTRIHPFEDGNGRTGRLLVNLFLRRHNLPHIVIPKVDNEQKMRLALRAADMGDMKLLEKFMKGLLKKSLAKVNETTVQTS